MRRIESGECATTSLTTLLMIPIFVRRRSSRVMPGAAGDTGCNDDDIGVGRGLIGIGARDGGIISENRAALREVEGFALRHSLNYVYQNDVCVVAFGYSLRCCCANVSATYHRYFLAHDLPFVCSQVFGFVLKLFAASFACRIAS